MGNGWWLLVVVCEADAEAGEGRMLLARSARETRGGHERFEINGRRGVGQRQDIEKAFI